MARGGLAPRGVRCALWSLATLGALDLARRHDATTLEASSGVAEGVKHKKKGKRAKGRGSAASSGSFLSDIEQEERQDAFAGAR